VWHDTIMKAFLGLAARCISLAIAGALTGALAGCGQSGCGVPCPPPDVVAFEVTGYAVVDVSSDCGAHVDATGTKVRFPASFVAKVTCHVRATLDDGTVLSRDLPLDATTTATCCGVTTTYYVSATPPVRVSAPAGYTPRRDAGALDAAND